MNDLLGNVNVSMCYVDGTPCLALNDTGSQITTISEQFQQEYLSNLTVYPLDDILKVEGAGGQDVPLLGYIEADIAFPEQTSGVKEQIPTILLIVPNTNFNKDVPVVIGTNCITRCMTSFCDEHGKAFLQQGKQDLAWRLAYKCMTYRNRKNQRNLKSSQVKVEVPEPRVLKPN